MDLKSCYNRLTATIFERSAQSLEKIKVRKNYNVFETIQPLGELQIFRKEDSKYLPFLDQIV